MTSKIAKLILLLFALSVFLTVGLVFHEADRGDQANDQIETTTVLF